MIISLLMFFLYFSVPCVVLQLELAAMALKQEGHELELLAAVESEGDEEAIPLVPEIISAPTMMSREARAMFLNGDKESGLAAWKARYYKDKMGVGKEEERRKVVESYIQGKLYIVFNHSIYVLT